MDERSNRLYELRCTRRLSQTAVGIRLNLSQSRVSAYERGDSIPSEILKEFSCLYCVSVDYILGLTDDKSSPSVKELHGSEHQLLAFYRSLSPECKKIVDGMVRGYEPKNKK